MRARHLVASTLRSWGLHADVPIFELAASELVSNALVHGNGTVEVRLVWEVDCVRLEVSDEGGGRPTMREQPPAVGDVGGWGLRFVQELADEWGTENDSRRTSVWMTRQVTGDGSHGGTDAHRDHAGLGAGTGGCASNGSAPVDGDRAAPCSPPRPGDPTT